MFILTVFSYHTDLLSQQAVKVLDPKKVIGEWVSTKRVIPYRAILKINSDLSFNYEFGSCQTHGISNGKWFIKDNYIVLNSNNPDLTLYLVPFDYRGIVIVDSNGKTLNGMKNDFPINQPNALSSDDQFVEFKNEKLYIKNDTLFHVSKFKNLDPRKRNMFTKK